jgi:polysaccharide deacetylase family protein (PEP-CTERM system associated)
MAAAVVNGLSFDVEDWFQVENLRGAIDRSDWNGLPLRVEASTRRILDLLAQTDTRATFFFLGWVAQRCPQLVREAADAGHEIASHGFGHELVYRQSPAAFRADVQRAKALLEDLSGRAVRGYRAPSFSITRESTWALDVLLEAGYTYDSSVFPISGHDRYGFAECGTMPFAWPNGLLEIPLAVYKVRALGLPVAGGGYFRLFPYAYFQSLLARINRRGDAFVFYLHPWELDPDQPRVDVAWAYRFRHYVNLRKTAGRLARLLRDFRFDRIDALSCTAMQAGRQTLAPGAAA